MPHENPYPPIAEHLLQNCKAINGTIDRIVLTYTGIYERSNGVWVELKNLSDAERPAVAVNSWL